MRYLNDIRKIFIFLFIIHLLFLRGGLFSNDEGAHYLLTRSVSENFPDFLDLSDYIKNPIYSGPYYSFFQYKGEIHAGVHAGLPILASPFYYLFGRIGIKFFNIIANLLTSYVIFLVASRLYGRSYGILAGVLYIFITPSLFYSTSIWHHTATALFFTLSIYQFLKFENKRKDIILLSLFSALTVLCSYYMIVPLSIFYIYTMLKLPVRLKLISVFSFFIFLLPAFAFNYANFGYPFLGEYRIPKVVYAVTGAEGGEDSIINEIGRLLSNIVALLITIDISGNNYSYAQKALFQSSPVLVLAFLHIFRRNLRFLVVLSSNLLLILMIAYSDGDFGGWELSMRYIFPVFPFLIVSLVGFLAKLKISFNAWQLTVVGLFIAILLLIFPIGIHTGAYIIMKILATFLSMVALINYFLLKNINEKILKYFIFMLILFSAFININDAAYGSNYRSTHALIEKSLSDTYETILFPANGPFGGLFLADKKVIKYHPEDIVAPKGKLTIVVEKSSTEKFQECKIETSRKFDSLYRYIIREKDLKKILYELNRYIILNLNCK